MQQEQTQEINKLQEWQKPELVRLAEVIRSGTDPNNEAFIFGPTTPTGS